MRRLTGGGRANTQARLESGRGCGTRRAGLCGALAHKSHEGRTGGPRERCRVSLRDDHILQPPPAVTPNQCERIECSQGLESLGTCPL